MTPAELLAECTRIAAIVGDRCYLTAHVMSGLSTHNVSVNIHGTLRDKTFFGSNWEEMFTEAEAYARHLVSQRHAGDIEFKSWLAPAQ